MEQYFKPGTAETETATDGVSSEDASLLSKLSGIAQSLTTCSVSSKRLTFNE